MSTNNPSLSTGIQDTIGGSDLSVFYMTEIPNLDDISSGIPLELCRKTILTIELDTVLSLSYSTLREKFPVRRLGEINPKAITQSIRTISGHIAFGIMTSDVLSVLRGRVTKALENSSAKGQNSPLNNKGFMSVLLDQLPPFNLLIMGTSERGAFSRMMLKGVSILDENQYQGTQQPNIINKVSFVALDIIPMTETQFTSTLVNGSMTAIDESYTSGTYYPNALNSMSASSLITDMYYKELATSNNNQ